MIKRGREFFNELSPSRKQFLHAHPCPVYFVGHCRDSFRLLIPSSPNTRPISLLPFMVN